MRDLNVQQLLRRANTPLTIQGSVHALVAVLDSGKDLLEKSPRLGQN